MTLKVFGLGYVGISHRENEMAGFVKWTLIELWDYWTGGDLYLPLGGEGTYGDPSGDDTYETKDDPYGEQ